MSRAFLSEVVRRTAGTTGAVARNTAAELVQAITDELRSTGKFAVPGFGTFSVRNTSARTGVNPRTGEKIQIQAGRTVRFKPSKVLKEAVE